MEGGTRTINCFPDVGSFDWCKSDVELARDRCGFYTLFPTPDILFWSIFIVRVFYGNVNDYD